MARVTPTTSPTESSQSFGNLFFEADVATKDVLRHHLRVVPAHENRVLLWQIVGKKDAYKHLSGFNHFLSFSFLSFLCFLESFFFSVLSLFSLSVFLLFGGVSYWGGSGSEDAPSARSASWPLRFRRGAGFVKPKAKARRASSALPNAEPLMGKSWASRDRRAFSNSVLWSSVFTMAIVGNPSS